MDIIPLYVGKRKNILVISGGGMNGVSFLGAITRLKELEIIVNPEIYCGTSAGSIISLLLNIGYSPANIYYIIEKLNFQELIVNEYDNILENTCFGFFSPDPLITVIITLLVKKNINQNVTFKELFEITKSKLFVTGTCINDGKLYYFSTDHTPDMEVITAIRISISIPILFKPYFFDNKYWIDGGCLNNYPIDLFQDRLIDVIGININDNLTFYENFDDIQSYIFRIIRCILKGQHQYKNNIFNDYTINIECSGNTGIDWSISNSTKKILFDDGYNIVSQKYNHL